jgi:hypothetical protein
MIQFDQHLFLVLWPEKFVSQQRSQPAVQLLDSSAVRFPIKSVAQCSARLPVNSAQ